MRYPSAGLSRQSPAQTMSDTEAKSPPCPKEFAWMKPGEEAVLWKKDRVFIGSQPFDNGGYWMVLIKGDNRPVTLTIPVYCSDLSNPAAEDENQSASPSEADTLRAELAAERQRVAELTAEVERLTKERDDWESDCREVREMLWCVERIYDNHDTPDDYADRDMYTRRVLNRFRVHQKQRGWVSGDGYQTLPAKPPEAGEEELLQLLFEARAIIQSLFHQRRAVRARLASLAPLIAYLEPRIGVSISCEWTATKLPALLAGLAELRGLVGEQTNDAQEESKDAS